MADTNIIQTEKKEIVIPEEIKKGRAVLINALNALSKDNSSYYEPGKTIGRISKQIKENTLGDYLSLNEDLQVSYSKDKEDPFAANNRITTTLGRYVRRNLKIPPNIMPDFYLNDMLTYVNRELAVAKDEEVILLSGKDIQKFYKTTKITSCMTGQKSNLTELYAINPDKINLAVYIVDGKVLARALFWHCDDGSKVLDRVYPDGSKNIYALINWARNKGYYTKYYGLKKKHKVTINVKNVVPYLDTFIYAEPNMIDKNITISNAKLSKFHYLSDLLNRYAYDKYMKSVKISPWEEISSCHYCGAMCKIDALKNISEELCSKKKDYKFCPRCFNEHIIKCLGCKKQFLRISRSYLQLKNKNVNNYCKDCAKIYIQTCNHCGYSFIKNNEKFYSVKKIGYSTEYKFCNNCVKSYCYILKDAKTESGNLTKENSTIKKRVKKPTKKVTK